MIEYQINDIKYSVFYPCWSFVYTKYFNSYELYRRIEFVGKEKFKSADFGFSENIPYETIVYLLMKDCDHWSRIAKFCIKKNRKRFLVKISFVFIFISLFIWAI